MKLKAKLLIYRILAYVVDCTCVLFLGAFIEDLFTTPHIEPLRSWILYKLPLAYSVNYNKWAFLFLRQLGCGITGFFEMSNIISSFLYFTFCWSVLGASSGQIIFGLIVLDSKEGNIPSFYKSFLRYIGYWLLVFSFYLGFFLSVFDKNCRGLHDMISGTKVTFSEEVAVAERETGGKFPAVHKPIWREWVKALALWVVFFIIEVSFLSPLQGWAVRFYETGARSPLPKLPLPFPYVAVLIEILFLSVTIIVIRTLVTLWGNPMATRKSKIALTVAFSLNVAGWLGMFSALSNISQLLLTLPQHYRNNVLLLLTMT